MQEMDAPGTCRVTWRFAMLASLRSTMDVQVTPGTDVDKDTDVSKGGSL